MAWVILFFAGLFEILWTVALKYSEGFTRLNWTLATLIALIISMVLLGYAAKSLPIGTAYAVWTGIGTVGAVILGLLLFNEPLTPWRLCCLVMILGGIIGLKLESTT